MSRHYNQKGSFEESACLLIKAIEERFHQRTTNVIPALITYCVRASFILITFNYIKTFQFVKTKTEFQRSILIFHSK